MRERERDVRKNDEKPKVRWQAKSTVREEKSTRGRTEEEEGQGRLKEVKKTREESGMCSIRVDERNGWWETQRARLRRYSCCDEALVPSFLAAKERTERENK